MKTQWLRTTAGAVLLVSCGVPAQASWILVDNFNGGGLTNWNVQALPTSNVAATANPLATGPSGTNSTVAQLTMTATAPKYALMTLNSTLSRGTNDALEVAFDLGYKKTDNYGYTQGISIQTSTTNTNAPCVIAGHQGYRGGGSYPYSFFTATGTPSAGLVATYSTTNGGQQQLTDTWYHYDLKMTASQSVLNVYNWVSNDPSAYVSLTPYYTITTTGGIGTGNYYLVVYNLQRFASSPDGTAQARDIMYVDNIYYSVPEPTALALLALGAVGLLRRR